jgi:thioredoxin-dependent peroxiredoxin
MLAVGSSLPHFEVKTTEGKLVSDVSLRGSPCVIFFFPRAFTSACIREAKAFRDAYPRFRSLGFEVLGVSTDPYQRQCRFAEWAGAAYPMVGDGDHTLARSFGVLWPIVSIAKRVTFVIDASSIVRRAFHFEVRIDRHIAHAEAAARELKTLTA